MNAAVPHKHKRKLLWREESQNKRKIQKQSPPSSWTWTRILEIRGLLLGVFSHVCVLLYKSAPSENDGGRIFSLSALVVCRVVVHVCVHSVVENCKGCSFDTRRNAYIVVCMMCVCVCTRLVNPSVHSNRDDTCAFPHCGSRIWLVRRWNTKKPLAYCCSRRHQSAYTSCCMKYSALRIKRKCKIGWRRTSYHYEI